MMGGTKPPERDRLNHNDQGNPRVRANIVLPHDLDRCEGSPQDDKIEQYRNNSDHQNRAR
jgi:hypothetical protein